MLLLERHVLPPWQVALRRPAFKVVSDSYCSLVVSWSLVMMKLVFSELATLYDF